MRSARSIARLLTTGLPALACLLASAGPASAQENWEYSAQKGCYRYWEEVATTCAASATFDGRAMRASVTIDTGADGQAPTTENHDGDAYVSGGGPLDVPAGESTYTAVIDVPEASTAAAAATGRASATTAARLYVSAASNGWTSVEIPQQPGRHTVSVRFTMPSAGRVNVSASIWARAAVGSRFSEFAISYESICPPYTWQCVPYPTGVTPPGEPPPRGTARAVASAAVERLEVRTEDGTLVGQAAAMTAGR